MIEVEENRFAEESKTKGKRGRFAECNNTRFLIAIAVQTSV